MTFRSACRGGVLALAGSLAFGPPPSRAGEEPKARVPDLSGRWKLNKELSDAAASASTDSQGARGPSQPKAGADLQTPGRGGHGAAGARTSRPTVPRPDDDPRGPAQAADAGETLTITQTDLEIAVLDKAGQARSLYPNGKTYKADEGASEVRSQWKDGSLLVEKKNVSGWRATETWQVAPDRSRLTVVVRIEGGSRPRATVKRVFDRAEPAP